MSNSSSALRLSPDERREQILSVALTHFSREHYEAVSMRAIAAEAGVTRELVYHYFPGKELLLEAVLRRAAETLLAVTAPDPGLSLQENLEHALDAFLDYSVRSGDLRDLYAPGSVAPQLVRQLAADNSAVQVERILSYADPKDTPMARLAIRAWLGFVTEAVFEWASGPVVSRADVIRLCMDALSAVTGSVFDPDS
jgi:AcrR family transcriptional regulator